MKSQLSLFEDTKHNCRNCTACLFITHQENGAITNRVFCIHGLLDVVIGDETNYFKDCDSYAELYCAELLGIPRTIEELTRAH